MASATDPDTWVGFEDARDAVSRFVAAGLGFAFSDEDPLVGVDLDDCRDPESYHIDPWAQAIIDQLDSYTEVSPSGTGVHVIVAGELPDGRNRSGDVECYDADRYFTVTGDHLQGTPHTVRQRDEALVAFHEEHLAEEDGDDSNEQFARSSSIDGGGHQLADDILLTRARKAKNGRKFGRLWVGETAAYDSHSETDMALCSLLAFWTACDAGQMDRLFRQSGLYREKWDEVHYADGSTYGEKTIERAIQGTDSVYQPPDDEFSLNEVFSGTLSARSSEGVGRRHSSQDGGPPE